MITNKTITDNWTAITSPGKSGTVWIAVKSEDGHILLNHSTDGINDFTNNNSFSMINCPSTIVNIIADSATDIFYAKCLYNTHAILTVDVL